MKKNMNVPDWDHYRIANEENIYYKIALLNAIPFVSEKGEEMLIQIGSEEFREFIAHLIQQGRFVEAKDIFELSKKVSQKDIERELYTITPLSLRLGYPHYLKVMMKALKEKTSASAILRRIIIEEVNNLIEELSNIPDINKELLSNIKKQASNLMTSVKEKKHGQWLFEWEWETDSLDSKTKHYFNEFIYDAIIAGLQREGLNPEIFKLMMPEKPKEPSISITGKIVHRADANQFILEIQFEVVALDSWDWDYYLYEYPLLVLEKFDPEEILKFHQATGSPGFKNMSINEVRELKEKAGKIPRDELVEAIFKNDSLSSIGNILAVYSEDPEDSGIYEFVDDWEFTFIPKILSIEIPIEIHQNEVVTADASIPLTDFKKVSRYIFNVYKERFDIKDTTPSDLVLNNLNLEETEKTLWMLAFREATLKVSEVIAKLIAESLPSSDVMKTSVPRAFPKLLEAFRGKKLRKILEEKIEGMTV